MLSADLFEVALECVIMYCGFFYYPGDLLFQPFWEAVQHLEHCGFKVMTTTFDGARESPAHEDPWLGVT